MKTPLSIVLPVHNEAPTIEKVLLAYHNQIATKIPAEIVVAEDGSTDKTKEVLQTLRKKIPIRLFLGEHRKGYGKAVRDALKHSNGDLIFFSDSDGQYYPSDFWVLWNKQEDYDMVIGWKVRRKDSSYRIVLPKGLHWMARALFGVGLHDIDCGFRLMRKNVVKEVVDEVNQLAYSFWAEFTIRAFLKGFKINEVPISHHSRAHGSTSIYPLKRMPWIVLRQIKGLTGLYSELNGRTKI